MLSERLEEWAHAYKAEGIVSALRRMLNKRFGVIPEQYLERIQSAPVAQIECWIDRAIDAPNLMCVFDDTGAVEH